jgi:isopentenyldiphosphate isomerase
MGASKTQTDTQKKAMIQAMEKSLGIVTTACRNVGIARDTHYRWMRDDDSYRASIESIEGMTLDLAESKLHEEILQGNTAAIIFFLKTKGKKRGYVEKQEVETTIKTPDFSGISTDELMQLLND